MTEEKKQSHSLNQGQSEEQAEADTPPAYNPADFMSPDPSRSDEIIIDDIPVANLKAEHKYTEHLLSKNKEHMQILKKKEEIHSKNLEKLSEKKEELKSAQSNLNDAHNEIKQERKKIDDHISKLMKDSEKTAGHSKRENEQEKLKKFQEEKISRRKEL